MCLQHSDNDINVCSISCWCWACWSRWPPSPPSPSPGTGGRLSVRMTIIYLKLYKAHNMWWGRFYLIHMQLKNIIFHLKPSSYRDIQSRTVTNKYIALSLLEAVLNSTLPLYNRTASVQPLWDTLQHRWQQTRILVQCWDNCVLCWVKTRMLWCSLLQRLETVGSQHHSDGSGLFHPILMWWKLQESFTSEIMFGEKERIKLLIPVWMPQKFRLKVHFSAPKI